ncbi:MAG: hypothetical protein LBT09_11390 [Planctomycetaceae bacterium]|nr:hypothetical protein [Planctomycetaceae bacterium]
MLVKLIVDCTEYTNACLLILRVRILIAGCVPVDFIQFITINFNHTLLAR